VAAYAATEVSLNAHLTELRRDVFTQMGALPIASLAQVNHGQRMKIGWGLVALQRLSTPRCCNAPDDCSGAFCCDRT